MAEDGLSLTLPPPMAYTKLYNKFPFSALHHVSLFEIYGPAAVPVMWILEVWTLGPKLWFQFQDKNADEKF
jgi:hypothetical protein